ncbi:LapA family protein [Streptacidiphilus sp. PB12-B1b]|uniref:LapA family protein n=1 Tax=Streptacidiphilus sp. PB12-B1b TaxID=2705012 RepID=UPI0015FDCFCB|nr:LapA family protein [Streptacidiphilus sp. PB12-B1b]QMU76477.1 LapA family protein [Streptacidiphilus sp. PB12-B1b]
MAKKSDAPAPRRAGRVTVSPRLVGGAVIAALAVWFILMNTASVRIHLWGISVVTSPLWVVLAVILLAGILIGWFLVRYRDGRRRR